jgi:hypothetical protein
MSDDQSSSVNTVARQEGGKKGGRAFRGSVFSPVANPADHINTAEGYLGKKGKNGFYSSRFFTVKGHYLKYCKNENVAGSADFCLGAIDLKLVKFSGPEGKIFKIIFLEGDTMDLKADSPEDAAHWVKVLTDIREAPVGVANAIAVAAAAAAAAAAAEADAEAEGGASISSPAEEVEFMVRETRRGSVYTAAPGKQVLSTRLLSRKSEKTVKNAEAAAEHQPESGKVNEVAANALASAAVGNERKVRRRQSITAHLCFAPSCAVFHFRESPYCHEHASLEPGSLKVPQFSKIKYDAQINPPYILNRLGLDV